MVVNMDQSELKQLILKVLKQDERLWNKDKAELNQTLLLDLVEKIDEKIIDLFLRNKDLREKFFVKIKDAYVFKTNDFRFFMEENKVDNSYTAYKNRIGLTDGKRFLKDTNDVVLDFPYKDCVLEGGQSTEEGTDIYFEWQEAKYKDKLDEAGNKIKDGRKNVKELDIPAHYEQKTAKRKEIFFNSILAHDEIDRLFDPKALTNWKIFYRGKNCGKIKAKTPTEIKRDTGGTIRENLIIKGNNLLALHSLKKQFAGKVKLIYIDPPYNTEGAANTFTYNNAFNHSTWLTFVKNRADISKSLLNIAGFFALSIDHVELFYAGILLDDIFGRENRIGVIAVETNPRGRADSTFFATSHEYLLVYALNQAKACINDLPLTKEQQMNFNLQDNKSDYRLLSFKRSGSNSTPKERPNLFYPIFFNDKTNEITLVRIKNSKKIEPFDASGKEKVWRQSKSKCNEAIKNGDIIIKENKDGVFLVYLKDRVKDGRKAKTFWSNPKYDASSHGTILLKNIFEEKLFSYPKSIFLMKDIVSILTNKDDIILDYHAGSGTTAHAVLELNKEDGGNRKFIMIEQMDYINTVTCPRVQKVMAKENIDDSFIYCELAKWNETAKEKIISAKNLDELIAFFAEMCDKYFLNYNLKIKEFREKVIKEKEFKNLSLDQQKKMFIAMLDNNQMYIPKTEMADKKYGISAEDQKLTKDFYNSQK